MNKDITPRALFVYLGAVAIPVALVAEIQPSAGPFSGSFVQDAPFSAIATTAVHQTLADGERVEQTTTARYYRDRAGRVRVEQDIPSTSGSTATSGMRITVWPDVEKGRVYTLDAAVHGASPGPLSAADWAVGGGDTFALPRGGSEFLIFHRAQHRRAHGGLGPNATESEEGLGTQPSINGGLAGTSTLASSRRRRRVWTTGVSRRSIENGALPAVVRLLVPRSPT